LLSNCLTIAVSALSWLSGLCAFAVAGAIVLLIGPATTPRRFDPIAKWGCRMILRAVGIRVAVKGGRHLRKGRTCLYVCNHVNIFDVFVLYGYIPGHVRGVELDEHFDWFFYGRIIRRLGMIPISQSNARRALASLVEAAKAIEDGTSIVILPEGGRTLDGRLQPFKSGSFLLAKRAGVDLVPMALVGAYDIKRKGHWLIRPGRMTLCFDAPISFRKISGMDRHALATLVRQKILSLLDAQPTQ